MVVVKEIMLKINNSQNENDNVKSVAAKSPLDL